MAGSDKKEQRLMAGESTSGGAELLIVQDPDVNHIVIAGDAQGLIHRSTLNTDQKTTITSWAGTLPDDPLDIDYFRLEYARGGSDEWSTFQERSYVGGDAWVPLEFTIPSTFFLNQENEGPFDLRYRHVSHQGPTDYSNRVRIYIDKVPPNGATPPSKMVFTVTQPITDASFGTNDYLEATIPNWTGDAVGSQIAFGWLKGELPQDPDDIDLIGPQAILGGGTVRIPKDKFLAAGDGMCCGGYVLIDKAGNISALSQYELMSVALGPLPPVPLPKPTVADATGGDLLREDIINGGVMVHVDPVTNGKSTDTIVVRWKDLELTPGTPVGPNPSTGFDIFVPWAMILEAYGSTTTGVVDKA